MWLNLLRVHFVDRFQVFLRACVCLCVCAYVPTQSNDVDHSWASAASSFVFDSTRGLGGVAPQKIWQKRGMHVFFRVHFIAGPVEIALLCNRNRIDVRVCSPIAKGQIGERIEFQSHVRFNDSICFHSYCCRRSYLSFVIILSWSCGHGGLMCVVCGFWSFDHVIKSPNVW